MPNPRPYRARKSRESRAMVSSALFHTTLEVRRQLQLPVPKGRSRGRRHEARYRLDCPRGASSSRGRVHDAKAPLRPTSAMHPANTTATTSPTSARYSVTRWSLIVYRAPPAFAAATPPISPLGRGKCARSGERAPARAVLSSSLRGVHGLGRLARRRDDRERSASARAPASAQDLRGQSLAEAKGVW